MKPFLEQWNPTVKAATVLVCVILLSVQYLVSLNLAVFGLCVALLLAGSRCGLRRLAVLSVLCGGQKLLLLDEPTYGQDARSVHAIMAQLRGKVDAGGLSVIFITHDRALAAAWADKIYWLRGQKLEPARAGEAL